MGRGKTEERRLFPSSPSHLLFFKKRHLHISHNAPYAPLKILHSLCFSFLLGITAVPREIENNAYAKVWGTNKVHFQGRCASGVLFIGTPGGSLCRGESVYREMQFWCCPRVSYFKAPPSGFCMKRPALTWEICSSSKSEMTNARGNGHAWN